MTQSIFVKRSSGLSSHEQYYLKEFKEHLNIHTIEDFKMIHRFDFEGISKKEILKITKEVFTNHQIYEVLPFENDILSLEYRKGQYDFIQDQLEDMASFLLDKQVSIKHHIIYNFSNASEDEKDRIKNYLLNPNEMRISKKDFKSLEEVYIPIQIDLNNANLQEIAQDYSLDLEDLKIVQAFYARENRLINDLELKVIATYWSDHCRHATFNTEIEEIKVEGPYKELVQKTLEAYYQTRLNLNHVKHVSLMDLATLNAKDIKAKGLLDDWDESQEVNAASIKIKIKGEDYLLSFKNETHNHPSEIEPYGGASTCIGGCIRDPMSGRARVYQAMRITGAKSPLSSYQDKHPLKLSQRQICQNAALGYSDYANQMGIKSDYLKEYYHDGYEAKRFELGALIASVKAKHVKKMEPKPGDLVLVLGGKTGKDGLGAALGSSKKQDLDSLENVGPEVQKGNPINERKLYRLFNRQDFTEKIKRSNDFGAGGLSVAIGELADGIDIYLDQMSLKEAMKADEIALSESQERMAIVIDPQDKDLMIRLASEENVEASLVAVIAKQHRLKMFYKDELVLDLDRKLLDTDGAKKKSKAIIQTTMIVKEKDPLNLESQTALREMFSNSNASNEILQEGMSSIIPNKEHDLETVSLMSCGFNPYISNSSPYHAGYLSVIEASSKIVAMGGHPEKLRLSFQEYFESLQDDPYKWGNATAALLGAFQAMKELDYPSIGGKDSMSGSFEDLSVPNSIVCFAVQTSKKAYNPKREFKKSGNLIALIQNQYNHQDLMDIKAYKKNNLLLHEAMKKGKIKACSTIEHSLEISLNEMSLVHNIGWELDQETKNQNFYGSYIVEIEKEEDLEGLDYEIIGKTVKVKSALDSSSLLDEVYDRHQIEKGQFRPSELSSLEISSKEKAQAVILVLEGTCLELELEASLRQLEIPFETFVYKSKEDNKALIEAIDKSNLIFLPDGFKQLNDVFDQGIQYKLWIDQKEVLAALEGLVSRKGLVIGSGAGAVGLMQSKLFDEPFKIRSNSNRKHISMNLAVEAGNQASIFTDVLNQKHQVRLDGYYLQIESEASIMKTVDKVNGEILNCGVQAHQGQVIASLVQIESDLVLLKSIKEYFAKEEI